MPHRILSVSQHKVVLETRNAVLRSAGYEVVTTMNLAEAEKLAQNGGPWAAAVLGDSIPYTERANLGRRLKKIAPGLPVVVLLRSSDPSPGRDCADSTLNALEGPEELLECLQSVIKSG